MDTQLILQTIQILSPTLLFQKYWFKNLLAVQILIQVMLHIQLFMKVCLILQLLLPLQLHKDGSGQDIWTPLVPTLLQVLLIKQTQLIQ